MESVGIIFMNHDQVKVFVLTANLSNLTMDLATNSSADLTTDRILWSETLDPAYPTTCNTCT